MDKNALHLLERLATASEAMSDQASAIAELAAGLNVNGVIWSGTVRIGSDGTFSLDSKVNFAAVTAEPHGASLTLAHGGSASSTPGPGVGVFPVAADTVRTFAMAGNQLTLFGTPGATVSITTWIHAQAPAGAELHPWGADATAASPARVAGVIASTVLAAANPSRRGLLVFNENAAGTILYLCFGPTAATNLYTVQIAGGAYYELPGPPFYRGVVSGIWTAATGAAQVTELV